MKTFRSILAMIPELLPAIIALESNLPHATGEARKGVLMSTVQAAAQIGETVPEPHVQAVSAATDAVVAALNSFGVFKK